MTYQQWAHRAYLVIGVLSGTYAALWAIWVGRSVKRARMLFAGINPDAEPTEPTEED